MFEVLGYKNTQKLLCILSISDPQISLNGLGCVKNDRNEFNSCGGPSHLAMHLHNHLLIIQPVARPIAFGIAAVGSGFIFKDDNARPHRTHIVENFHERKVVMTKHING